MTYPWILYRLKQVLSINQRVSNSLLQWIMFQGTIFFHPSFQDRLSLTTCVWWTLKTCGWWCAWWMARSTKLPLGSSTPSTTHGSSNILPIMGTGVCCLITSFKKHPKYYYSESCFKGPSFFTLHSKIDCLSQHVYDGHSKHVF
jgi:hypothetical protein